MARLQTVSSIERVELFDVFQAHGGSYPAVGFFLWIARTSQNSLWIARKSPRSGAIPERHGISLMIDPDNLSIFSASTHPYTGPSGLLGT